MTKVLNLYAGLGGNRKLWTDVDVTAVEYNQEIADIYKDLYPNDIIIVDDAHTFLAKHWKEYDFIWSSPPCQSHSKVRMMASKAGSYDAIMPDMNLWSEIIFLQAYTKNTDIKYVVENVKPYYTPLIEPTQTLGRHLIWSNIDIPYKYINDSITHNERGMSHKGFIDISKYKIKHRKDQLIRNSVNPEIGKYILQCIERP